MSIIGNPIMAGASGPAASIFVTGLSETDTVTATKGAKTLTGKWTQKPNPAYVTLPDGYTQLEYIESTGTQYIDTGFICSSDNAKVVMDFKPTSFGDVRFCGAYASSPTNMRTLIIGYINNKLNFGLGSNDTDIQSISKNTRYVASVHANNGNCEYDVSGSGSSFSYSGTIITGLSFYLFAICTGTGASYNASMVLYSCKLYQSGIIVKNFIPAKRNSDSAIGLYDLVSNTFFENAGTGAFTAGPEIPQTIDGFLIKPIRDFGTWTVTATYGTDTYTQDVLVDVITEYEIEITKKLYLYRDGDECEDVTGGWSNSGYSRSGWSVAAGVKNSDNMLVGQDPGVDSQYRMFGTVNAIDCSVYHTLKIQFKPFKIHTAYDTCLEIWTNTSKAFYLAEGLFYDVTGKSIGTTYEIALPYSLSGQRYIAVCGDGAGVGQYGSYIYKVWLE